MNQLAATVVVIGTGSAGSRHLRVLGRLPSVEPLALPKRKVRVSELRQEGVSTVSDLAGAVEKGASLCIVASDTGQHLQDALQALERGLDVLVEKPMARDSGEARYLKQCSMSSERNLFVGCVLRFSRSLNKFRRMLPQVGCLHSMRIEAQSYLPEWRPGRPYRGAYSARADEGGVLRDMVHEIDYAGWIFGWPGSLQARVRNLGRLGISADEAAELSWETPEGCAVSICLDYLSRPTRRRMAAYGQRGTIEWDGIKGTVTMALQDEPLQELRLPQTNDEMFLAQAAAFIQSANGPADPKLATGDDGVRALDVCDAARQASESRREEKVAYP